MSCSAFDASASGKRAPMIGLTNPSSTSFVTAAPISLYGNAPLTCQFVLEDHAVRHSYHHLARIRAALGLLA